MRAHVSRQPGSWLIWDVGQIKMTTSNDAVERNRKMSLDVFPDDIDAVARGVRLMELLLANPWGAYAKETEEEIAAVIGPFGHKKSEIVLAGGGTSLATWPGSCGDLLNPAAFICIHIVGEIEKPRSVTFSAVVKGLVRDCYASHRYLRMDVQASDYRIYATT